MHGKMKIYIWRHSRQFSSWSMFDEPHIYNDNYMSAEIAVLAGTEEEALDLLKNEQKWNIEEIRRIEPRVLPLDGPAVISYCIKY